MEKEAKVKTNITAANNFIIIIIIYYYHVQKRKFVSHNYICVVSLQVLAD
jgi:hypothetical protein